MKQRKTFLSGIFACGLAVAMLVGGTPLTAMAATTFSPEGEQWESNAKKYHGTNGASLTTTADISSFDIGYDDSDLYLELPAAAKNAGFVQLREYFLNFTTPEGSSLTADPNATFKFYLPGTVTGIGAKMYTDYETTAGVAISDTSADSVTMKVPLAEGTNEYTIGTYSYVGFYLLLKAAGAAAPVDDPTTPGDGSTVIVPPSSSPDPGTEHKQLVDSKSDAISSAKAGETVVITKEDDICTLPNYIMQALVKKGNVTLVMDYTYEGKDYHIVIPAGAAIDSDIPYYGPLYLASLFGTNAASGTAYTVQSGDTLGQIAAKLGTSVADLLAKNPAITDPNVIIEGQKIAH